MKVFVTKYALTKGIFEADVEPSSGDGGRVYHRPHGYLVGYGKGEWHETREAAFERAEEMRVAKVASLKKKIARIEKLRFA